MIKKLIDKFHYRKAVIGIAYKKNVDDMHVFPSVELMEILRGKRAYISFSDPYVPHFQKMRKHSFDLDLIKLNSGVIQQTDCLLIATDHYDFDHKIIADHANLIVDTLGVYPNNAKKCGQAQICNCVSRPYYQPALL